MISSSVLFFKIEEKSIGFLAGVAAVVVVVVAGVDAVVEAEEVVAGVDAILSFHFWWQKIFTESSPGFRNPWRL
jgi:hypothetical protein